jgi:hypothetical protein
MADENKQADAAPEHVDAVPAEPVVDLPVEADPPVDPPQSNEPVNPPVDPPLQTNEPPAPHELDLCERLGRLEAAIGSRLGIHLGEFDDRAVVVAREALLHAAAREASRVLEEAFVKVTEPLSESERLARLERAIGL